jgi:hypothetical protein
MGVLPSTDDSSVSAVTFEDVTTRMRAPGGAARSCGARWLSPYHDAPDGEQR